MRGRGMERDRNVVILWERRRERDCHILKQTLFMWRRGGSYSWIMVQCGAALSSVPLRMYGSQHISWSLVIIPFQSLHPRPGSSCTFFLGYPSPQLKTCSSTPLFPTFLYLCSLSPGSDWASATSLRTSDSVLFAFYLPHCCGGGLSVWGGRMGKWEGLINLNACDPLSFLLSAVDLRGHACSVRDQEKDLGSSFIKTCNPL